MEASPKLPINLSQSNDSFTHSRRKTIDHILYHTNSMAGMAQKIMALPGAEDFMFLGKIAWGRRNDGQPLIEITDVDVMHGRSVIFLTDFQNPEDFFDQISVLFTLPKYFAFSLTVIMSYFPVGTMERVDYEGQVATASTMCRILSAIPTTSQGPAKIIIYDIHALQERFYFTDHVIPVLQSAIPILKRKIKEAHGDEDIAIAFPDEGAFKRFSRDFSDYPCIICSKVREGDKRIVTIKEGNPEGKNIFVVDDLVRSGGTLIETQAALRLRGANKLYCFVTHSVFPGDCWKRFAKGSKTEFDIFYTTDSCPTIVKNIEKEEPFQILSLAPDLFQFVKDSRILT
jgi:phosphoribosylpyrophosphate synthetase